MFETITEHPNVATEKDMKNFIFDFLREAGGNASESVIDEAFDAEFREQCGFSVGEQFVSALFSLEADDLITIESLHGQPDMVRLK